MKKILVIMALALAPFLVMPATNAPYVEIKRNGTSAGSAEIAASAAVPLFFAGLVGLACYAGAQSKKALRLQPVC